MANKYERGEASDYAICNIGSGLISKSAKCQRVVATSVGKNLKIAPVTSTDIVNYILSSCSRPNGHTNVILTTIDSD